MSVDHLVRNAKLGGGADPTAVVVDDGRVAAETEREPTVRR